MERPAPSPSETSESLSRELHALPAPRHLHEYLTRSQHLHMGFFERPDELLPAALDRLVLRDSRLLPRNSLVADVGCGLGGTTRLLASQGHRVFGFDPCLRSIDFARKHAAAPRAQFLACGLEAFAERARGARFDAVVLIEVLSSFTDFGAVLASCRSVLRPGGLMLVHDVVRSGGAPQAAEVHLAQGALRTAADSCGFDLVESRDLTNRTSPTLSRLGRLLSERHADLLRVFAHSHPSIQAEIEAYQNQIRVLEFGFARQELTFEASVLRCSSRLASDSVVLRPRTHTAPLPAQHKP